MTVNPEPRDPSAAASKDGTHQSVHVQPGREAANSAGAHQQTPVQAKAEQSAASPVAETQPSASAGDADAVSSASVSSGSRATHSASQHSASTHSTSSLGPWPPHWAGNQYPPFRGQSSDQWAGAAQVPQHGPWYPVSGAAYPVHASADPQGSGARRLVAVAAVAGILGLVGGLVGSAIGVETFGSSGGSRSEIVQGHTVSDNSSSEAINARNSVVDIATRTGEGSGVILTSDGYVLTNNHVVERSRNVQITLPDGETVAGTVVATDSNNDLALIKADAEGLTAAKIANSDEVGVGDTVFAIGSPFGLNGTITKGIVSAVDRQLSTEDSPRARGRSMSVIQTDAAINPGNSGGALVDAGGNVVGINTAIASTSDANAGIGFAIPSNKAKEFADEGIAQHQAG